MIFDEPGAEVSRAQNSAPSQFPLAFSVVGFFGAKREGRRSGAGSWARFDTHAQAAHRPQTKSETFRSRARSVMSGRLFLESAVGPRISRAGALLKRQCVYSPTLQ